MSSFKANIASLCVVVFVTGCGGGGDCDEPRVLSTFNAIGYYDKNFSASIKLENTTSVVVNEHLSWQHWNYDSRAGVLSITGKPDTVSIQTIMIKASNSCMTTDNLNVGTIKIFSHRIVVL